MNYISNLHTHTTYCDGKNTIEENILCAIEKNFISLGFSGHSYLPFDNAAMSKENTIKYLEDIKKFKNIYKDKIQIYSGIEADYYSNLNKKTDREMMLDYRIGSVHFIKDDDNNYFSIDASKQHFENTLKHFGNIKEIILRYYNNVINMINNQNPDIIGHLDLIRKYNFNKEYFTEKEDWYIEKLNEVLEVIKKSNSIVEINTRKMNKDNLNAHYPNSDTIKKLLKLDIPIIINTDSHSANGIDYFYYEMIEKLKSLGYSKIKMLIDNSFKDISLN
ncbi:histidinol-phosphatase [Brachyspira pilosicoli]|uniref:histidinol-phosphatase n=1 Tax=Brachyspira pilosicoli TaxID=52584 RepID=UPI003004E26A